jgi:hypothetical protein
MAGGLTFFSKETITCPVCETQFHREELRTGRGRLNAGDLTRELRRKYIPSQKYGEVYPIIYPITVCPSCYFATLQQDFEALGDEAIDRIRDHTDDRHAAIEKLFDDIDFTSERGLKEGFASYFFATMCYDFVSKEHSPTIKQAICTLRAAWCANDLHRKNSRENYDYLAKVFYRKSRFFYTEAVLREQSGEESLGNCPHLGPDTDKNYGYDGVLYIAGLLEFHHGPRNNQEAREEALVRSKRMVGRLFGMGRASKNKPTAILDNARDLYDEIARELGVAPDAKSEGEDEEA